MKRRNFMKMLGAMTTLSICGPVLAREGKQPNLLIVHTDEHNFRTLGCYRDVLPKDQAFVWGKDVVETPHIDSIAKEGALCSSFYATTPVCSPSRGSFISGRYPQNTPVVKNGMRLGDDIISFAEVLKGHGYATGYAGKWHLDGAGKPQWAPEREFGFTDNRFMYNRGHWKKMSDTENGPAVAVRKNGRPSYNVTDADEKSFTTDWLADKAVDFIRKHKAGPFCYMVSIPDPHGPNSVRAPYNTMYDKIDISAPKTFRKTKEQTPGWGPQSNISEGKLANTMKQYYGMVKCIDDNVGKIIKTLKSEGVLENTILIFTSDHGDLCGEHRRFNKGVPYEASAKIPFVIRYTSKIKAGTVVRQALGCVDFMPTVLSLMGFDSPDCAEGRNAAELLTGVKREWKDIAVFRSTGGSGRWLVAVTEKFKLVFSNQAVPWLFDLKEDPDELVNFMNDLAYRKTAVRLTREIVEYAKKFNDPYVQDSRIKSQIQDVLS